MYIQYSWNFVVKTGLKKNKIDITKIIFYVRHILKIIEKRYIIKIYDILFPLKE